MAIGIERPLYDLIEDYLVNIFKHFNAQIDIDYKVEVYAGRQAGDFINEVENTAVLNLYAQKIINKSMTNLGSGQDTVTFHIDTYVAPKKNNKFIKTKYQDEAAHKFLLLYTHYARRLLTDLSIKKFGFDSSVKVGNFRYLGADDFESQYSENEVTMLASRTVFTLDVPFCSTDSGEYSKLAEIIIAMNDNIVAIFNYEKE